MDLMNLKKEQSRYNKKQKDLNHKNKFYFEEKEYCNLIYSEEEIDRMVKEAEANADADKAKKEEADLRNECSQYIFHINQSMKNLGAEVTAIK